MSEREGTERVGALVDDLFRREAGRLVARLARILGPAHLDLAEDVVQDALLKALHHWSHHGTPDDPHAWLVRVARNLAIDRVRRDSRLVRSEPELQAWEAASANTASRSPSTEIDEVRDDELAMMFACCQPALSREASVALCLKTVGGFGVPEIARAFLENESTIAQRLVRAKACLRDSGARLEAPSAIERESRLPQVRDAIYFMLNEGLAAHRGEALIRADLVREALRLATLLASDARTATPEVHALAALACFQASRLAARTDGAGGLLLLQVQDRSKWDRATIARGFEHLRLAAAGAELCELHIEAGIASQHAIAESWEATDWAAILGWYDLLVARSPSPIVRLNRAVAVAELRGPDAGLREVEDIERAQALASYHLRPSIKGEFLRRLGRTTEAAACFREALELCRSGPERAFLQRKLDHVAERTHLEPS